MDAQICHLFQGKRDPNFDQRILRIIDWRWKTNHTRATLSLWDASSVLCWLKKIADNKLGKTISLQEFQDKIVDCDSESCELFINDHMQYADISSADVYINGAHRGTIFQNGFSLPCRRGLKFQTVRDYISRAFEHGWFSIPGDTRGNEERHLQLMGVLAHIREDEIAQTVLYQWIKKKRIMKAKDTTIPKMVWEGDIRRAEKIVFDRLHAIASSHSIEDVRKIFCVKQDEGEHQTA